MWNRSVCDWLGLGAVFLFVGGSLINMVGADVDCDGHGGDGGVAAVWCRRGGDVGGVIGRPR